MKPNISEIIKILENTYPGAKTELKYTHPFQLVVAAQLSAQCTDVRVNKVTQPLFKLYKTPADFSSITEDHLISFIKSCGLYKNKAKNIIACAKTIVEKYAGSIPDQREILETLPGVGRKTANVVLAVVFQKPAFAVDTHVFRVSRRLGLSTADTPVGVERDITKLFPKHTWIDLHHQLILHGRNICKARKPSCPLCPLQKQCSCFSITV